MTGSKALEVLNSGFVHTVKDPLWGNIPMTEGLRKLISIDEVGKLSRIKQNGPAFHIYPGAVHTRLSHSIGVYHIGRMMLLSIARKREELPFTERGMMSFLSACLLHDIGHFPYAHSLKEVAPREHEEIARSLIRDDNALRSAIEAAGADPEMTGLIIDKDEPCADKETGTYRSILSGTLDPDKLDYLSRDAFFAGIPYGRQDTDYIISSISLVGDELALESEAIGSVEQVLFSKYMMYRSLYWHKGVRSATAMIKKAVLTALRDGVITFDDLATGAIQGLWPVLPHTGRREGKASGEEGRAGAQGRTHAMPGGHGREDAASCGGTCESLPPWPLSRPEAGGCDHRYPGADKLRDAYQDTTPRRDAKRRRARGHGIPEGGKSLQPGTEESIAIPSWICR